MTALAGTIHDMLHEVLKGVMIGVGVTLVLGALSLGARYGARLLRWGRNEIVGVVRAVPRGRMRRAHARAVKKAAAAGESFIASHRREGSCTVARWVGARREDEFYYHDLRVYRRDMETGKAPRMRSTCCGKAPPVGSRRKAAHA